MADSRGILTQRDVDEIRRLWSEGISLRQIVKRTKRAMRTVQKYTRKLSPDEILERRVECDKVYGPIRAQKAADALRLSDDVVASIRAMRKSGMLVSEVAETLGVCTHSVSKYARTRRNRPRKK